MFIKGEVILFSSLTAFIFSFIICPSYGVSPTCSNIDKLDEVEKWAIVLDYDEENHLIDKETLRSFDMVVLDPDNHPDITTLKKDHLILLAYISVGEAENYRFYWDQIQDKPWVLEENADWEGNFFVDVRDPEWRKLLIEEVIPKIVEQGFQGLFLDTIDTAVYLEEKSSEEFDGSLEAMVSLVGDIHQAFPKLMLLSNNGFEILEKIAPFLSGLIVEDINMMIDFENDSYKPVSPKDRAYKIGILKPLMDKYGFSVFNIDYVPQSNRKLIRQSIRESRRLKFKPYVAEARLADIYNQYDQGKD